MLDKTHVTIAEMWDKVASPQKLTDELLNNLVRDAPSGQFLESEGGVRWSRLTTHAAVSPSSLAHVLILNMSNLDFPLSCHMTIKSQL